MSLQVFYCIWGFLYYWLLFWRGSGSELCSQCCTISLEGALVLLRDVQGWMIAGSEIDERLMWKGFVTGTAFVASSSKLTRVHRWIFNVFPVAIAGIKLSDFRVCGNKVAIKKVRDGWLLGSALSGRLAWYHYTLSTLTGPSNLKGLWSSVKLLIDCCNLKWLTVAKAFKK